jgi:hypothetical protein
MALTLTLATLEGGARLFAPFHLVDGSLYLTHRVHEQTGEGEVRIELVDGRPLWFRERPDRPPPETPKRRFRIVVFGDSVFAPALVSHAEGFTAALEGDLGRRGLDVEVVNLAQSGWNVVQIERFARDVLPGLEPDLVLVGTISNDLQEFAYVNGQLLEARLAAQLDSRPTGGVRGFLGRQSYLYNLFWLAAAGADSSLEEGPEALLASSGGRVIVEPLRRLSARAAELGAPLVVVCNPVLDRPFPGTGTADNVRDRCAFAELLGEVDPAELLFIDGTRAYYGSSNESIALDHVHLTPHGLALLAELVGARLVEAGLVGPTGSTGPAEPTGPAESPAPAGLPGAGLR